MKIENTLIAQMMAELATVRRAGYMEGLEEGRKTWAHQMLRLDAEGHAHVEPVYVRALLAALPEEVIAAIRKVVA
jgi:hypothetical protein